VSGRDRPAPGSGSTTTGALAPGAPRSLPAPSRDVTACNQQQAARHSSTLQPRRTPDRSVLTDVVKQRRECAEQARRRGHEGSMWGLTLSGGQQAAAGPLPGSHIQLVNPMHGARHSAAAGLLGPSGAPPARGAPPAQLQPLLQAAALLPAHAATPAARAGTRGTAAAPTSELPRPTSRAPPATQQEPGPEGQRLAVDVAVHLRKARGGGGAGRAPRATLPHHLQSALAGAAEAAQAAAGGQHSAGGLQARSSAGALGQPAASGVGRASGSAGAAAGASGRRGGSGTGGGAHIGARGATQVCWPVKCHQE